MLSLDYLPPQSVLKDHVSVYYECATDAPQSNLMERAGIAQLRFILRGGGKMRTRREHCAVTAPHILVVGPSSQPVGFDLDENTLIFGIGLMPAGWMLLCGSNAYEFQDRLYIAPPAQYEGLAAMADLLADAPDMAARKALFDAGMAQRVTMADQHVVATARLVEDWLASSPSPEIADLVARAGQSHRTIARQVKDMFGHTPKMLSRKYRALRAARALASEQPDDDIDYLAEAFYDQSHMIREIKHFTGMTPKQLRSGKDKLTRLINRRAELTGKITPLTART